MKNSFKRSAFVALAGAATALSSAVVPTAATAAPHFQITTGSVAGRPIQLNYCWGSSTVRTGCPRAAFTLNTNGLIGANPGMPGSSWTETPTTLTIDFINPTANVTHVVYQGTRTLSTNQICDTGTMTATRNLQTATMTGSWSGCIA